MAFIGQGCRQIYGGGRLTDAALLVQDRDPSHLGLLPGPANSSQRFVHGKRGD